METLRETKPSMENVLFPNDVRKILKADNDEIKNLCRKLKVYPKKDKVTGKTFFLKNDVEFLMRIKELHERGKRVLNAAEKERPSIEPLVPVSNPTASLSDNKALAIELKEAIENMVKSQDRIAERIEKSLEDKLEGLDEVVVELIQMKTENENLRIKLNQLTKENYDLRNSLNEYRHIGFGLFVK